MPTPATAPLSALPKIVWLTIATVVVGGGLIALFIPHRTQPTAPTPANPISVTPTDNSPTSSSHATTNTTPPSNTTTPSYSAPTRRSTSTTPLSFVLPSTSPSAPTTNTGSSTDGVVAITNGEQLTTAMMTYSALGVSQAQLQDVNPTERISTWPGNPFPHWIPQTPYVYNNDPNNHGGIVPAGGLTIDGFFVPAGVWVSQFQNYTDGVIMEGTCGSATSWPGIVFRGDRFRGSILAPGFFNENGCSTTGGKAWFLYNDMGGLGAADAQINEVPLKLNVTPAVIYHNYISYTTTGVQINTSNCLVLENYIEKLTLYGGASGPSGTGPAHLNGFTTNGGIANIRIERNKILLQSPDDAGHSISQTDAISFFQDFNNYPGGGVNDDGTTGYRVLNNYLGGGGYTIYAGTGSYGSVSDMAIMGNKFTTQWWPKSGYWGVLAAGPTWGTNGNIWSGNTWADGASAGQGI